MAEHDDDDIDFAYGGADRHDSSAGGYEGKAIQDKLIGDADTITVKPPQEVMADAFRHVAPPPVLATNQATMECLRGPCVHLWSITARFHAQSDRIHIARVRQCNAHTEPTELTEQNVFHCDLWWPRWLAFVPESARTLVRARLRHLWEELLRKRGYNFDWKTWEDEAFEQDDEEQRGKVALGVGPATFFKRGNGKKPSVTAAEDGLYFNVDPRKQR